LSKKNKNKDQKIDKIEVLKAEINDTENVELKAALEVELVALEKADQDGENEGAAAPESKGGLKKFTRNGFKVTVKPTTKLKNKTFEPKKTQIVKGKSLDVKKRVIPARKVKK